MFKRSNVQTLPLKPLSTQALMKLLTLFTLLTLLTLSTLSLAAAPSDLDGLLRDHVAHGSVDYTAMKADARLSRVVKELSSTPLSRMRMTPQAAMAFWINVYNVFTLKLICDNWPVKSIMDLDGGKVWDRKWISIDGQTYSLNQIENDVIRPMGDARIHFALVCAATSCPPLRNEAYVADKLDRQLDDQGRQFLGNKKLNRFSASDQTAKVSKIFEWYGADVGSTKADLIRFLAQYAPSSARSSMKAAPSGWKVSYLEYDWSINGR